MQVLCGLQGLFLLFNCQTSGSAAAFDCRRADLFWQTADQIDGAGRHFKLYLIFSFILFIIPSLTAKPRRLL